MNKKFKIIIVVIMLFVITVIIANANFSDKSKLSETFIIKAIYLEDDGYVEITFEDKSKKSKTIILEILGLPKSFQKNYTDNSFNEKVYMIPSKYGWSTHPVIFVVNHEEFGKIGIKTEIRPIELDQADIIFSYLGN